MRGTRYKASRSAGRYVPSPIDFIGSYYGVVNRWRSETAFSSDPAELFGHPSFQALVDNVEIALPLIMSDLKTAPSNLVFVLEKAFGVTPYAEANAGDLRAMTDAWLAWGERNERAR